MTNEAPGEKPAGSLAGWRAQLVDAARRLWDDDPLFVMLGIAGGVLVLCHALWGLAG